MISLSIALACINEVDCIFKEYIICSALVQKNYFGELCHRTQMLFPFGKPIFMHRVLQNLLFLHAVYLAILLRNIVTM